METIPVFVGLDYHSKSVQVAVMDAMGKVLTNRRCGNSVIDVGAAVHGSVSPLDGSPRRRVVRVAVEACCGSADLAEGLIEHLGWPVSLSHPGYVNRMKHNPDKTDHGDARILADLSRAGMVPEVWLAPEPVRELRTLVRTRADFVSGVRSTKNRILAVLRQQRVPEPEDCGRWSKKWLAWLSAGPADLSVAGRFVVGVYLEELSSTRARVHAVEACLRERTGNDVVVQRLLSIKGVGEVTAWTMRAIIGRFDRFRTGKQLARCCAVTPRNASSGQRVGDSGMIRAGDPLLKNVVIEAAHRLRRYDERWQKMSDRMKERGKPTCVIVGAIANRWVRSLFHEMKGVPQA